MEVPIFSRSTMSSSTRLWTTSFTDWLMTPFRGPIFSSSLSYTGNKNKKIRLPVSHFLRNYWTYFCAITCICAASWASERKITIMKSSDGKKVTCSWERVPRCTNRQCTLFVADSSFLEHPFSASKLWLFHDQKLNYERHSNVLVAVRSI